MKKITIFLSVFTLTVVLLAGCGGGTDTQETTETEESTTVLDNTEIQPEPLDYSFPVGEESFELNVNGVKIELGKTIREILADLNAQPFYYDEKNVPPKQFGGLNAQLNNNGYGVLGISGFNKSQDTVYNSDTYAYQVSTDILNDRDMICTFKDNITFGSTYESIIEVYGEPLVEEDIIFEDRFNSLGGQPNDQFCEENGIPLKYDDPGKYLKYSNGGREYIEFMIFENTGLSYFSMYYDIGQL